MSETLRNPEIFEDPSCATIRLACVSSGVHGVLFLTGGGAEGGGGGGWRRGASRRPPVLLRASLEQCVHHHGGGRGSDVHVHREKSSKSQEDFETARKFRPRIRSDDHRDREGESAAAGAHQ